MKIITLAQQKGGVGKTTVCVNLACQARRRKKRAVILDMDTEQGSAFFWGERRQEAGLPPIPVVRVRSHELPTVLERLRTEKADWVLIDLPGRNVPSAGLSIADLVLLPCRPVEDDVRPSLATAKVLRTGGARYAYLMNIAPSASDKSRARKVAAVLSDAGHIVAGAIITERMGVPDANARGMGINEREPKSESAREYSDLYKWIEDQLK
jgi:chromosome partitioning protein